MLLTRTCTVCKSDHDDASLISKMTREKGGCRKDAGCSVTFTGGEEESFSSFFRGEEEEER